MEYKASYFKNRASDLSVDLTSSTAKFPENALIELSNACNHFCVFCNNPRMKRKVNILDRDTYFKFLTQGYKYGLREVGLYATGEPFMIKDINWYISTAKKIGIERVYLTSNGSLASLEKIQSAHESGLDSIKFSINAATRETYKIIHGKDDFVRVTNTLKKLYEWKMKEKKDILILGSFIYTKLTEKEIPLYKKKFSKYMEDIKMFPAGSQGGRINNIIEKISTENIERDPSTLKPCDMIWNRLHLTCEGFLTACCIDYELDLVYADFKNSKKQINTIWNNSIVKKLREKHINMQLDNTVCKNCLTGSKEKYDKLMHIKMSENKKIKTSDVNKRTLLASQ
jgi:MoaA/NifB/PqqE/SkfB family radical SAM enzyme